MLENIGLTDTEAKKIEHFFFRKDREGMRELAALWKPGVPVSENAAYVERAKELNAELETALVSHLDESPAQRANQEVPPEIEPVVADAESSDPQESGDEEPKKPLH